MDINAVYTNNCGQELEVFFIELLPNSSFDCSQMNDMGSIAPNTTIQLTVHQGKIGFAVFATSPDGKCSSTAQKATAWIDGSAATTPVANFNTCN